MINNQKIQVEKIYVSVVNSSKSVALSGYKDDLDKLIQFIRDSNLKIFARYLDVPGAFHCPYMEEHSSYQQFVAHLKTTKVYLFSCFYKTRF